MDSLGEAVERYNKPEQPEAGSGPMDAEKSEPSEDGGGKGHTFHIHKHKDGKHHLTVHGENGQLTHHSEHDSLDEAAEEMKSHGE